MKSGLGKKSMSFALVSGALTLVLITGTFAAYGTSFSGPNIPSPGAGTLDGTTDIALTISNSGTASTDQTCASAGGSPCISNELWTPCPTFQGSSVQGGVQFLYYAVHEVFVVAPNGNNYFLGSSSEPGLANHHLGTPITYTTSGLAPEINVTQAVNTPLNNGAGTVVSTDSFAIPFGPSTNPAASNILLTSVNAYNVNQVNPEGGYYWWQTTSGSTSITPVRLDLGSLSPTSSAGTYTTDIEGDVVCGHHTGSTISDYGTDSSGNVITNSHLSGQYFDTQSSQTFTVTTTTSSSSSSSSSTSTTTTTTTVGGATRTMGWWQTHLAIEEATWASYIAANPSGATICGLTITTAAQAMGGFQASISKDSTGAHRDSVSHAEMILVQQWVGALLNQQLFGTTTGLIASGQAACNTDNANTITSAAGALDGFNSSGDNVSSNVNVGNATPQAAKAFADDAFWDAV